MTGRVGIIGLGRFGSHLNHSLRAIGYETYVYQQTDAIESISSCDHLCIAVRDDQIQGMVQELSKISLSGKTVLIHSGVAPLTYLAPLQEKGACIGKFHPLQAFTHKADEPVPKGTPFAVEGHTEIAQDWAKAWECPVYHLSGDDWQRYHLAAVMAANFLPLFVRAGAEILEPLAKDQGDALQWLAPLVQTTIQHALDPDRKLPFSGPAIRGDQKTIETHLAQLKEDAPHLLDIYKVPTDAILKLS